LTTSEEPPRGLRELKRIRTISVVQNAALDLFLRDGYESTTIQQIAAAAEISESTFFRYFPTKEDVVLRDDLDPLFEAAIRDQPAELAPIDAVRVAFRQIFALLSGQERSRQRERLAFVLEVPELRSRVLDQLFGGIDLIARALAERTGRPADDFDIRVFAGAFIGACMTVIFRLVEEPDADVEVLLDRALEQLSGGFPS
jgi:AcrR family transcriptional regulator